MCRQADSEGGVEFAGFIDIHTHALRRPMTRRDVSPELFASQEMLDCLDQAGICKSALLPIVSPEAMRGVQSTEEVISLCRRYPEHYIPFCNVDPRMVANRADAPLDELLGLYKAAGCKGVGEVTCNLPFSDSMVENLFKHVQAAGLPLTFHIAPTIGGTYGLYDEPGLPLLEGALGKFPGLVFLGHSQAFWCEIGPLADVKDRLGYPTGPVVRPGRAVELMRRYPNLCGDLSAGSGFTAISRDESFGCEFLDEFQDRLYFGTDISDPRTPSPLRAHLLKLRKEKKVSETVFRKVSRENAVRLLNLDTDS